MNNLYRRIVTMGMISFSAALAWIYCILAYRDKVTYVVVLSLVLVISLYALLNSIISLHLTKQEDLKKYISDTVNATLANMVPSPEQKQAELDRAIEAERLAKATYVQLRKVNTNLNTLAEANSYNAVKSIDNYTALTLSLKETIAETVANTAKVIIKYNKTDNQNIIDALNELTQKMQGITEALEDIYTRIDNINIVAQPHTKTTLEESVMDDMLPDGIDVLSITTKEAPKDTAPDITEEEEDVAVNSFFDEFETKNTEAETLDTVEAVAEETTAIEASPSGNQILSQDDIEALFKSAMPAEEAVTEPEPVVEEAPAVSDDPNRPLSPDEIAALFAASTPAAPVVEPEPVAEEAPAVNDDPNRPLSPDEIAALFAASAPAEPEPTIQEEDKIIPFPVAEEAPAEPEPAPIAEEFDPNKPLSPDEIAALFASMNSGN